MPTEHRTGLLASPLVRSLCAAAVAFAFYALWAAWANRMHDVSMIRLASLTQGSYSAAVTFVMTSLVEFLYRGDSGVGFRVARSVAITIILLVTSSVAVHLIVGTAEVLATVLPSWLFGSAYALSYALGLARAERRRTGSQRSTP
ncbi:MAG: hypothetical protein AAGH76_18320 [Pseudomonadota bacterium]